MPPRRAVGLRADRWRSWEGHPVDARHRADPVAAVAGEALLDVVEGGELLRVGERGLRVVAAHARRGDGRRARLVRHVGGAGLVLEVRRLVGGGVGPRAVDVLYLE